MRNQQHLNSSRNSMLLNAFSYMENISRSDSFSSIYVSHILTTFNIFSHIEILFFTHYILPFFRFFHNYT